MPRRLTRPHRAVLLAFLATVACARSAVPPTLGPPPPDGPKVTFLHINDVYEITPIEGGAAGGLARVATIRKRLEARGHPVLMTLGGDFLAPSALGTARVGDDILAGRHMVAVLNAAGLDWATLGNHELDIGESRLARRIAESRFRWVSSNVTDSSGVPFAGTVRRAIVPVPVGGDTLRIGLVGALTPVNRVNWVRYEGMYDAVKRDAMALRDSVDALVGLTHLYYYEDEQLAIEVPALDLILGGHEHENFVLRRGARWTPIVKSDGNARSVQVVTLHFPRGGGRPVVTTELVPVTSAVPEDPAVKAEVEQWLDRAFEGYVRAGFAPRERVATLPEPLDAREVTIRVRGSNLTDVILAAMRREDPDAEVALFNAGSVRVDDVIPAGVITQYDVIRILPFGGPLVHIEVPGDVLARTLTTGARNTNIGAFLHASGATVTPTGVMVHGAPIDPARRYRVVTTDFLLTGREVNLPFFDASAPGFTGRRNLRDVRFPLIEELRARYGAR